MICRHCQNPARVANRPRGLCWTCYYTAGVRDLYAPLGGIFGAAGARSRQTGQARALPTPTDAEPGTPEKIAVLEERARLGQQMFHPKDAGAARHRRRRRPAVVRAVRRVFSFTITLDGDEAA